MFENFQVDRRVTQEENEVEYQQALVTIKEKIRQVDGPDMKETMQDQIRQWFIECRYVSLHSFTCYFYVYSAIKYLFSKTAFLRIIGGIPFKEKMQANPITVVKEKQFGFSLKLNFYNACACFWWW